MFREMILALAVAIICTFGLPPAHAQDKPLTTEEQTWLEQLAQDPARVRALIQAERNAQLMEHWDTVTAVGVNYLTFCYKMNGRDPGPEITRANVGESVVISWGLEMPRKMPVPFDVQIVWKHNGVIDRLDTSSIDAPSYNYRLWDRQTLRKTGTWTAAVVYNGNELATTTLVVSE